jgi:hypothetical protein
MTKMWFEFERKHRTKCGEDIEGMKAEGRELMFSPSRITATYRERQPRVWRRRGGGTWISDERNLSSSLQML